MVGCCVLCPLSSIPTESSSSLSSL
jgi:hypothetical protein